LVASPKLVAAHLGRADDVEADGETAKRLHANCTGSL